MSILLDLKNRKRIIAGILLGLGCLAACLLQGAAAQGVVFAACFAGVSVIRLSCSSGLAAWLNGVWCGLSAPVAVVLTQLLLNVGLASVTIDKLIFGTLAAGMLISILFFLTMNYRVTVIIGIFAMLVLATVNHFVFWLRGSEFAPYDIFAAATAFHVAEKYVFEITTPMIYSCVIGMLYCFCGFMLPQSTVYRSVRNMLTGIAVTVALFAVFSLGITDIKVQHFGQMGSFNNGYILNFALQFRNLRVNKPDGYDAAAVRELEKIYQTENVGQSRDVDVIAIMSEAFGDMAIFENDVISESDIMPFVSSLRENTIRGHALVSGIGGGTSNSEYEFLTANSLGLLPTGCFPFQQYIEQGSYSVVTGLENYGFTSLGTHPARGDNWMRITVYPSLGFDDYAFVEKYPGEKRIRGMVSDQEMFEQLIRWYEEKDPEENEFLFGVTMQNHSPYDFADVDFAEPVVLQGLRQQYPDAEQYLSLLKESDKAFEKLIAYLSQIEKDVVLIVFGDHMPQLSTMFYEELHGGPFETLEEQMLQYTVPFFIWANYDIEEREVGLTSINFLSNYVYEAAGLPDPAYNAFLKDVQKVIPAMNGFGYYSNTKGMFIPYEEAEGEEAEMLNRYRILQYNGLFDKNNRSEVFFPEPVQ